MDEFFFNDEKREIEKKKRLFMAIANNQWNRINPIRLSISILIDHA